MIETREFNNSQTMNFKWNPWRQIDVVPLFSSFAYQYAAMSSSITSSPSYILCLSHSLSLAIFLIINLFEFDNRQEYSRWLPQIYFICTKFRANKLTTSIRNRCCVCVTFFYIFSSVAFSHFTHKIFFGFSPFVLFWIYEQCVEAKPHLN